MRDENSGVREDCLHSGVKDAAGTLFQFGASPPGSLPNPASSLLEVPGTERGHAIAALHSVLPFCRFRVVPATRPWTAPAEDRRCRRRTIRGSANHLLVRCPSMRSSENRHGMPAK